MRNMPPPSDTSGSEQALLEDALEALRAKTAVEGELIELEPHSPGRYRPDALISLAYHDGTTRYFVECKSLIDRKAQLDQVRRQLDSFDSPGLLIASYITKELAEHCQAIGLQFVDTCGNAYLRAPGLFILIMGEKSEGGQRASRAPKGLTNAAGLRVAFALLCQPVLVKSPLKDIASNAGVSLGTAFNVLEDLERRGYLINKGQAERRKLLERRRLMEEWVINYPSTLRLKLNGRRFTASDPSWWERTNLDGVDFAWGSEVAAKKLTGYLKPSTQTLYVQSTDMSRAIKDLAIKHRIKPDPDGNIEILEKFWHWKSDGIGDFAPPLLVYSELLAILDPRAQETANIIKERFVDAAFN